MSVDEQVLVYKVFFFLGKDSFGFMYIKVYGFGFCDVFLLYLDVYKFLIIFDQFMVGDILYVNQLLVYIMFCVRQVVVLF